MRICQSCPGSSAFGFVMTTPAIGPATVGASGLELLDISHAAAPAMKSAAIGITKAARNREVLPVLPMGSTCCTQARPERAVAACTSHARPSQACKRFIGTSVPLFNVRSELGDPDRWSRGVDEEY